MRRCVALVAVALVSACTGRGTPVAVSSVVAPSPSVVTSSPSAPAPPTTPAPPSAPPPALPPVQIPPVDCEKVAIRAPFPFNGTETTWQIGATPPTTCAQAKIMKRILSKTFITVGPTSTEATYAGWQCSGLPRDDWIMKGPHVIVCRKGQRQIGAEWLPSG
jgi:hypothetical protein